MSTRPWFLVLLGTAVVAAGLTVYRLYRPEAQEVPKPPAVAASAPAGASQAAAESAPATSAVAAGEGLALAPPAEPLAAAEITPALNALVGNKAAAHFLQTDDFARRLVATVDNLGREHAPSMLWPVTPTTGRFATVQQAGGPVISADNGQRYTPFVLLVEGVDPGRAVELYARMQPLLQQAYQDLGFPQRRFDQRLLQVIDLMLAAPEPAYPVRLVLTEVKGPMASERPWQRYEYADPTLEARPAGQKLMMRMGPVNERRLKTWLRAFRQQLVQRMQAR